MPDFLVIRGARLFDGLGGEPVEDGVVVVQDDRVMYAGRGGSRVAFPEKPLVIDADGRALIPGMIDCHVHLCFNGSGDFAGDADAMTPELAHERCRAAIGAALEGGITTVRDLGGLFRGPLEAARAQRSGAVRGARVITASEVLTSPGGHVHFMGREITGAAEMTKGVRDLHEEGATVIKVVATGGVLTPGIGAQQSAFPDEVLRACVDEAHRLGLRVAAHAIGAEGIEAAVRAGVDSIEHGCFLTDPSIAGMVSNPTWLVATLSAPDRIAHGGPCPDYARQKSLEVLPSHAASFGRAVNEGVRIASGTDAGTPYNFHGRLADELRLMHGAGMPLDRVLQAATREAAQLLGLGELGTIEPDKIADLVLLDGDPTADVGAFDRVSVVIQGGRVAVDRR